MGRKFTIFALFYFVFEGKFQVQAPRGAYIRRGDLTEGFLRYDFGGLIFGGAYTWRGLFSQFYGISSKLNLIFGIHVMVNIDSYKKVSTDQCHMTVLQAQVSNSLRWHVFLKVFADQTIIGFQLVAGS